MQNVGAKDRWINRETIEKQPDDHLRLDSIAVSDLSRVEENWFESENYLSAPLMISAVDRQLTLFYIIRTKYHELRNMCEKQWQTCFSGPSFLAYFFLYIILIPYPY